MAANRKNMRKIGGLTGIIAAFFASCTFLPGGAGSNTQKLIIPVTWNNYTAAVSLTFDDGSPSHLENAIPGLDARGLAGTFFVIAGDMETAGTGPQWADAAAEGHEVSNHSFSHPAMNQVSRTVAINEINTADTAIAEATGVQPLSFAYPFYAEGAGEYLIGKYPAARGLYLEWLNEKVILPDSEPDWSYIPSLQTTSAAAASVYRGWIRSALKARGWTVLTMHGIGVDANEFEPISMEAYAEILDFLVENQADIWTAPFGEVAAYLRASFILKQATVSESETGETIMLSWGVPSWCPGELVLKVKISDELAAADIELIQDGEALMADELLIYELDFTKGQLQINKES